MRYQTLGTFSMVYTLPVQPPSDMRETACHNKVRSSVVFLVACQAYLVRLRLAGGAHKFEGCP
jgi:hypothetical protein